MCGICGIIGNTDPEPTRNVLQQMLRQMHHRGPDDEGVHVDGAVALGMRRLSIIDVDGGHQPVFNEDKTLAVVFNGEIYNFQELRATLESRGYHFRTNSDTEVIVYAYEEWGEDCVDHFEGMFAFALAETSKSTRRGNPRVLLARDRLGIKPLYYSLVDGNLIFASEVRTLLASGQIEPKLSQTALRSYLLFRIGCRADDLGRRSLLSPAWTSDHAFGMRAAHARAAGTVLGVRFGGLSATQYQSSQERCSAASFLRSLLEEAVESHLIADVPVGVFLSSGIDSTALAALAARKKAESQYGYGRLSRAGVQRGCHGSPHREKVWNEPPGTGAHRRRHAGETQ